MTTKTVYALSAYWPTAKTVPTTSRHAVTSAHVRSGVTATALAHAARQAVHAQRVLLVLLRAAGSSTHLVSAAHA